MDYPHLERLSAAECRLLLPGAPVGRLVVPTPNFPTLDPVSFALVEGALVVAVPAGSAGDALPAGSPVAFEADVLDHKAHRGWSVVVKGPVEDLDPDVAELVRPSLTPWPAAAGDRLLLIRSEQITGQRIVSDPLTENVDLPGPTPGAAGGRPRLSRRDVAIDEALGLLRHSQQHVGRLAISVGGEPLVFPLNYALDGDAVVFHTQPGTKLSGITRSLATFEVDCIDASGQGWAVSFEGLAQEVLDADPASLRARIDALSIETWPGGLRPNVVRITPYAVRGTVWATAGITAAGRVAVV